MDDELQKIAEGKSDTKTAMAVFAVTMKQTRDDVKDVKGLLAQDYATKAGVTADVNELDRRLKQVENIVFGGVKLILVAFALALIGIVISTRGGN